MDQLNPYSRRNVDFHQRFSAENLLEPGHHESVDFKRDSNRVMRQMKKTKEPIVLTVKGKAAVVIEDAECYQKLLEPKEQAEVCGDPASAPCIARS